MLSTARTPRFRNISATRLSRYDSSLISLNEKHPEDHRNPEKECFMCRQANVYIKPIGMQQERRVARRHPPILTRTQIEELRQKKTLTKKEVRKLLQCYFPEIRNVKYFQLHKYHSCCYDPKHLNLCKNHITALQHEREQHLSHEHYNNETDEDHYKSFERDDGYQNRVSFVRIKVEPTKGIPTRFLAPVALPEPLVDMLIKQVNRLENKRKAPTFCLPPINVPQTQKVYRLEQMRVHGASTVSEQLPTLVSEDDDDVDDDDNNNNNNDDEDRYSYGDNDSNEDNECVDTVNSGIRGYYGNIMGRSRIKYEETVQIKQEKQSEKPRRIITNKDLVVEDVEDLKNLFINEQIQTTVEKPVERLKKKKRKKRTKKHSHTHQVPKLNHWEVMALEQSKKEICGCRHHVQRLEANQIMYDWCRCKDHQHKEVKAKQKPILPTLEESKQITPVPKTPKVETKTIGINATEPTTTELALAYDPSTVDYDVIQETIYYRTSSGRMVKPEITNSFTYDNIVSSTNLNHHHMLTKKSEVLFMTDKGQYQPIQDDRNLPKKNRSSSTLSNAGLASNSQDLVDSETSSTNIRADRMIPISKKTILSTKNIGRTYDDDDNDDKSIQTVSPEPMQERPMNNSMQSPIIPMSQRKSSKPTFVNKRATPNYENQSTAVGNRRWFDQPLGDQNLLPVHDGRYGLIAGTSTDDYVVNSQLPDNDYTEHYARVRIPSFRRCPFNCESN
ncbi:unnamed protein product [Rotaria socialis]|uniref:Uncharacterized protein n=2 Tax=Rotaria socialis TaxID=392032 RepID=A0A817UEF9_9BILA|nr:unnamed protein product [Rotaria socialis]CAF4205450.1 unnamed protein product [Rotaria socialis]